MTVLPCYPTSLRTDVQFVIIWHDIPSQNVNPALCLKHWRFIQWHVKGMEGKTSSQSMGRQKVTGGWGDWCCSFFWMISQNYRCVIVIWRKWFWLSCMFLVSSRSLLPVCRFCWTWINHLALPATRDEREISGRNGGCILWTLVYEVWFLRCQKCSVRTYSRLEPRLSWRRGWQWWQWQLMHRLVAFVKLKEKKKYLFLYALPFLSWLLTSLCTTGNVFGSNPNAFVAVLFQGRAAKMKTCKNAFWEKLILFPACFT